MSETRHVPQAAEQFQSNLEQYKENSDIVQKAIQNRENYTAAFQAGEALNDVKHQLLIEAANSEDAIRDIFQQWKKESSELVQRYISEDRYQDAMSIIAQLTDAEAVITGIKNEDTSATLATAKTERKETKETVDQLKIFSRTRRVSLGDEELKFPSLLYSILYHLAEHRGEFVSRKELAGAGWPGLEYDKKKKDVLDQALIRIRRILGENVESYLTNRRGYGCMLSNVQIISH